MRTGNRPHAVSRRVDRGPSVLNRILLTAGLLLGAATAGYAQQGQQQQPLPNILEERAYVRRFSAGITGSVTPFPLLASQTQDQKSAGPPPVEIQSKTDPNTKPFAFGFTAQVTLTNRLALTVQPILRSFNAHTTMQRYTGTDNASTSFDDRDRTDIDETVTGRHLDIPLMLRIYTKGHRDEGARWLFEVGPVIRLTRNASIARKTYPSGGGEIDENIPVKTRTGLGFTAGIGAQLIDDFGIRATPEFRFTHWVTKSISGLDGNTRGNQIELLFTIGF